MNKELITNELFQQKVLDKFKKNFKKTDLYYSNNNNLFKDLLRVNDFTNDDFVKIFISKYIDKFQKRKDINSFFKDLTLSVQIQSKFGVSFTDGAKSEKVFENISEEDIKDIHHVFFTKNIFVQLYLIALISTKDVVESISKNKNFIFDEEFSLKDAISNLLKLSSYNIDSINNDTLLIAKHFQDYFLLDLKYHLKNNTLDEEMIGFVEKTFNHFFFHNHSNGYTLTPLHFEFLSFLDIAQNTSNPNLKEYILSLKKDFFNSYTIDRESLTNLNEAKKYFSFNFNYPFFDMKDNVISIHEDQIKVFDLTTLFVTTDNQTNKDSSLANFLKKSKNINSFLIKKHKDFINIEWQLSNETPVHLIDQVNNIIQEFIKDKLENIENYVGEPVVFSKKLKNECRELDLCINLIKKEKQLDYTKSKLKI